MSKAKLIAAISAVACITLILIALIPLEKINNEKKLYGESVYNASLTDDRVRYMIDNPDLYYDGMFSELKKAFNENNGYTDEQREKHINFAYNYPWHKDDYLTMTFTDDELHSEKVPALYMSDSRWAYETIGGDYIFTSGCMTVSITMAYLYLKNNGDVDPVKVARLAEDKQEMFLLSGINADTAEQIFQELGINAERFDLSGDAANEDYFSKIKEYTDNGNVVLIGASGDVFGNHAIVVRECFDDETLYLNDPASKEKTAKLWNYNEIENDILYFWKLSA